MNNEKPAYAPIKECVKETGISEFSIRKMIASGEIAYITCGNKYLLNRAKLIEYLENVSMSNVRR